jgi:hypothetical protein
MSLHLALEILRDAQNDKEQKNSSNIYSSYLYFYLAGETPVKGVLLIRSFAALWMTNYKPYAIASSSM